MVTRRVIDCTNATSKEALHQHLKEVLLLPDYYGGNLDALFDCLTQMCQPAVFRFLRVNQLQKLGDYGLDLIETFRDASEENPILELVYPDPVE